MIPASSEPFNVRLLLHTDFARRAAKLLAEVAEAPSNEAPRLAANIEAIGRQSRALIPADRGSWLGNSFLDTNPAEFSKLIVALDRLIENIGSCAKTLASSGGSGEGILMSCELVHQCLEHFQHYIRFRHAAAFEQRRIGSLVALRSTAHALQSEIERLILQGSSSETDRFFALIRDLGNRCLDLLSSLRSSREGFEAGDALRERSSSAATSSSVHSELVRSR